MNAGAVLRPRSVKCEPQKNAKSGQFQWHEANLFEFALMLTEGYPHLMMSFRRNRFMGFTNALLALLLVMVAGRSEANCFPFAPEPGYQNQAMESCSEMEAGAVGDQHSDHPDQRQAGMCHLVCLLIFKADDTPNHQVRFYSPKYLREIALLMVGMNAIPQTPPPRFV